MSKVRPQLVMWILVKISFRAGLSFIIKAMFTSRVMVKEFMSLKLWKMSQSMRTHHFLKISSVRQVDFWVRSCQQASGGEGTTTDLGMERMKAKNSHASQSVSSGSNFSVLSWRRVVLSQPPDLSSTRSVTSSQSVVLNGKDDNEWPDGTDEKSVQPVQSVAV